MPSGIPIGLAPALAAEALPFGVAITDRHGFITWTNAAYAKLTGHIPEELPGQSAGAFSWDALAHRSPLAEPWRGETVCLRKTGEAFTARNTITTLRNPDGEATGFCIISEDIIEQRQERGALDQASDRQRRDADLRYRRLFDSMQEGVAIHKLIRSNGAAESYVLLDVNRRYEEILSLRREDVVNRPATDVYKVRNAPYLAQYASVVDTGTPLQFETHYARTARQSTRKPSRHFFRTNKGGFATSWASAGT